MREVLCVGTWQVQLCSILVTRPGQSSDGGHCTRAAPPTSRAAEWLVWFSGGPCRPPMHPVVLQTASQDLTLAGHHFLWETTVWIHSMHACMTFLPKLQVPKEPLQRLYQCPSQHILPPPSVPHASMDVHVCSPSVLLPSISLTCFTTGQ